MRLKKVVLASMAALAGLLLTQFALAQGSVRILSPRPAEVVRGEIEARFDRPLSDQGYLVIRLDDEFKEATSELRYIVNTRKLRDGEHTLTVDARDERGRPAGLATVTFRVANDAPPDPTGPGIRLIHWSLDDYVPAKRLIRLRVWAEGIALAVQITPPSQAMGGGMEGGMPGMGGMGMPGMPGMGGMGMPGGPRGGAMGASRFGQQNNPYQGPRGGMMPGMPGMGGPPGSMGAMGGGAMGMGGMPGMGGMGGMGGGTGGPVDMSALDRQISLLVRTNIREVKPMLVAARMADAANIRLEIATALERGRESQQMMGGMGMGGGAMMGGMPGMGGASGAPTGAKPPWSQFWTTNQELANKTFTKTILPSGEEIRPTGRQWFLNPHGKMPVAPLIDLLPRFPEEPIQPGTKWNTPMTFIPELIEMTPVEVQSATMAFTAIEELPGTGGTFAKLESEIDLPESVAKPIALIIAAGTGGAGAGGEGGMPGMGGAMGGMMGGMGFPGMRGRGGAMSGSRIAPPNGEAEIGSLSSQYQGALGSFGPVGGMMGQLSGMGSGGMGGMRGRMGGMMGGMGMGGGAMGGGEGMGGGRQRPRRPGEMGPAGGGGMGGGGGGGRGRWVLVPESGGQWFEWMWEEDEQVQQGQQDQDIKNLKSTIKRVIHFDHRNRTVYRIEDTVHTEFDIMGQGGGGMEGGMPGMGGMMGGAGAMGGMPGEGQPPVRPEDQPRTHVIYRVRIVAWQDTNPVPHTFEHPILSTGDRFFLRANRPHDYDSVQESFDRPVSAADPKRPEERVFVNENRPVRRPAAKTSRKRRR